MAEETPEEIQTQIRAAVNTFQKSLQTTVPQVLRLWNADEMLLTEHQPGLPLLNAAPFASIPTNIVEGLSRLESSDRFQPRPSKVILDRTRPSRGLPEVNPAIKTTQASPPPAPIFSFARREKTTQANKAEKRQENFIQHAREVVPSQETQPADRQTTTTRFMASPAMKEGNELPASLPPRTEPSSTSATASVEELSGIALDRTISPFQPLAIEKREKVPIENEEKEYPSRKGKETPASFDTLYNEREEKRVIGIEYVAKLTRQLLGKSITGSDKEYIKIASHRPQQNAVQYPERRYPSNDTDHNIFTAYRALSPSPSDHTTISRGSLDSIQEPFISEPNLETHSEDFPDAVTLADLVNEALIEQARRQGMDMI